MKLLVPLSLILTLFISSCSTTNFYEASWDRSVANEIEAPLDAEKLFTIYSTSNVVKQDLHYETNQFVEQALYNYQYESTKIPYSFVEDPKMPADEAFKIIPTIEGKKFHLIIKTSPMAKFDADANAELIKFLTVAIEQKLGNPYGLYEIYFNAKANDFPTLMALAKIRTLAAQRTTLAETPVVPVPMQTFEEKEAYWAEIMPQFESQERKYNKLKKVKTTERKAIMDALDKVSDDQQFRNLVAKNDRKGAAKLLRSYLPWEEMPPFEKLFWETHLKVMADPLPLEKRILIYRGIDDDIIQKAQIAGKALSEEEAFKDQKIFVMSTMMTKNQGTWNRRLRSLTAMYEKFMGTDKAGSSEFTSTIRITNMFKRHSYEPKGSPFLSFTPNYTTASTFGHNKISAYFLDPRLMYFNYASEFKHETEFLLPITSFPDDLAGAYSTNVHKGHPATLLQASAVEKLEKALGAGKGQAAYDKIVENSKVYFQPIGQLNGIVEPIPLDGNATGLLKTIIGKNTEEVAQVIDGNQKLRCMDLIQLFWK